jgi:hypothetical protein
MRETRKKRTFDAFAAARRIRDTPGLSTLARLLAFLILSLAEGERKPKRKKRFADLRPGESKVGASKLAALIGRPPEPKWHSSGGERQVRRALRELRERGVIFVVRSGSSSKEPNVYAFPTTPPLPATPVTSDTRCHQRHPVTHDRRRVSLVTAKGVAHDTDPDLSPDLNTPEGASGLFASRDDEAANTERFIAGSTMFLAALPGGIVAKALSREPTEADLEARRRKQIADLQQLDASIAKQASDA